MTYSKKHPFPNKDLITIPLVDGHTPAFYGIRKLADGADMVLILDSNKRTIAIQVEQLISQPTQVSSDVLDSAISDEANESIYDLSLHPGDPFPSYSQLLKHLNELNNEHD